MNVQRRATVKEASQLSSLIHDVAPSIFEGAGSQADIDRWLTANAGEDSLARRLADDAYYVLLTEDDKGDLIGSGYLHVQTNEQGQIFGYIGGTYCRIKSAGVGRALAMALLAEAYRRQCQWIDITVGEDNEQVLMSTQAAGFVEQYRQIDGSGIFSTTFVELRLTL